MNLTQKGLNILAGTALSMFVITVVLFSFEKSPAGGFAGDTPLIQGLGLDKINAISLRRGTSEVTLERQGNDFLVKESGGYPASAEKVNKLLLECLDIRCMEKITENTGNHKELGVDQAREDNLSLRFYSSSSQESGPGNLITGILIGKDTERTSASYVRLENSNTVYTSEKKHYFSENPVDFLDTQLLNLKREDIDSVTIVSNSETFTINRNASNELLLGNIPQDKRGKNNEIKSVFEAFSYLYLSAVTAEASFKGAFEQTNTCKLPNLTYQAQVATMDGKYYIRLSAFGPSQEALEESSRISKTEDETQLKKKDAILTAAGTADSFNKRHSAWVYEISEWKAKNLTMQFENLVEVIPADEIPAEIAASHILIAYQGADRAQAERTKEEARKLADELLANIKDDGADFAETAKKHSDCPSKESGGDLGTFGKGQMHPKFEEAAWKLKVLEVSGVVETPFGFHIIRRTK
ncbi:MAG: peptidylprolyl isomerase [Candidatus Wallbacteria bacterium]|nr:peptidylprolyl isomerase [Candidatus Wallbacteria bacterium]